MARRAAAIAAVAALVVLLVVAATDAGGPWSSRLGMTAALSPLVGALGASWAVRIARARGELLALAAVGADPGRAIFGAVLGGTAIGAIGALVASSGYADTSGLFPQVAARVFLPEGAGLYEPTLGLHLGPGGALSIEAGREAAAGLSAGTEAFTRVALAAAALACPAWVVEPQLSLARRVSVGAGALAAAIVVFQGVAAHRFPPPLLLLAPLLLLTDVALARYGSRQHVEDARIPGR
jgi:hypothetical protein